MKKLEEENKINSYMVSEKLPKELEAMRRRVQYLQTMAAEPAVGQADVQELEEKVGTSGRPQSFAVTPGATDSHSLLRRSKKSTCRSIR